MESPINYFSEKTLNHLKSQQGLSERYQRRALDVTLVCKLTHVYGKYHLAMLHRELAMSEELTTYQQAERQAAMMNQITVFQSSPSDFLHTQEQSTDESIDVYKEYRSIATSILNQPSWISSARRSMRTRSISSSSNRFVTCTSLYMPMRCSGINRARLNMMSSACNFRN